MKKLILVVLLVVGIGVGWWLGAPLFLDKTVDEDFPTFDIEIPDEISLDKFDEMLGMPEDIANMTKEEIDKMEGKMLELAAQLPDVVVDDEMMEPKDTPEQKAVEAIESPLRIAQGEFVDGDDFHKGSGNVKIFQLPDGKKLLRLEDFSVTNGPDLFVYLVKDSDDVKAGFYDVGRLKGNKGNQNYELPADVNIDDYETVVVYCRAFSVLFSSAELK